MPLKRRKRRRAGDIKALKVEVWAALCEASAIAEDPETPPDRKLRAVSAIGVVAGMYRQLLDASNVDARLTALEHRYEESPNGASY
jgi:hypothetical protein